MVIIFIKRDAYASQPTQMITFYSHPFPTFFIALNERASNLKSIHEKNKWGMDERKKL